MGNIKSFCCREDVSETDDSEERARILSDNNVRSNSLYNQSNSGQDDLSYGSINTRAGKSLEQSALDRIFQRMAANVIDVAPGESMIIQPAEFIERQKAYQARLNQIRTPLPLRYNNKVHRQLNNTTIDTRLNNSLTPMGTNQNSLCYSNLNTSSANQTIASNNSFSGYNSNVIGSSSQTTNPANSTGSKSLRQVTKNQEKRRVEYEPISVEELQLMDEISERTVKAIRGLKVISQEPVVTCFQP